MHYQWDFVLLLRYAPLFWRGVLVTLAYTAGTISLGLIVGLAFVYLGVASISLPYYAGTWGSLGGALATIGGWACIGTIVWAIRKSSHAA